MSKIVACIAVAAVLAHCVVAQASPKSLWDSDLKRVAEANRNPAVTGNRYVGSILGGARVNNSFPAGEELRLMIASAYLVNFTNTKGDIKLDLDQDGHLSRLLKFSNFTFQPAFNFTSPSAVRVRVIAAHASRGSTGAVAQCSSTSQDVWAEFWGMSPRNYAFGRQMIFSGFTTFTTPPFPFRICVKDVGRRNSTKAGHVTDAGLNNGWSELMNHRQRVFRPAEPLYLWRAPSGATAHYAGDYAAFEILSNAPPKNILHNANFNATQFSIVDSVKLVPFGYPCSYEKYTSSAYKNIAASSTRRDQYCGANSVLAGSGEWNNLFCELEGSVAGGVARVGTRENNPFTTTNPQSDETRVWTDKLFQRNHLVAYWNLPAAGTYDVCVSTKAYRKHQYSESRLNSAESWQWSLNAMPVWFKAYDASSSSPCSSVTTYRQTSWVPGCRPRSTTLTVAAATSNIVWSTDDRTPGSWGEIKFTALSGTLNFNKASQWEFAAIRDYFNLTNGDQFRLVGEQRFAAPTAATAGTLGASVRIPSVSSRLGTTLTSVTAASVAAGGSLSTVGNGNYKQYQLGTASYGTQSSATAGGCFWSGDDNYGANGLFGNPGDQCCSTPPCTSTNFCTLSDSGDVNGPTASGDLGGNPRIGYSPWAVDGTGTNSWAYIRVPQAGRFRVCYRTREGHWRVLFRQSTTNATFTPSRLNSGYTYHFNDSRSTTWGPLQVTSKTGATLDMQAWNYYTAPSATAVGSALKIVRTTESCYTSAAQSRTYSINPGAAESTSLGSADDSATLTRSIFFYVRVPAQDDASPKYYRICFRRAWENWNALADPNYLSHLYMNKANEFGPRLAPGITYTLVDRTAGSWGKFIFARSTTATQSFNVMPVHGDMVRLVPNVTSTGVEVNCDIVNTLPTGDLKGIAQFNVAARRATNLGLVCASTSLSSGNPCHANFLTPTDINSISANTPYTDVNAKAEISNVGLLDSSIGFVTIPSGWDGTRPLGYKVCYKNAQFSNWIETTGATGRVLTVTSTRTVTVAAATTLMFSGSYTYLTLTATAAAPITPRFDLVKLVPIAETCEAGVTANGAFGQYSAISGVSSTHCVVDATSASTITNGYNVAGTTTTARAYMTLPVPTGGNPALPSTATYRVCYMARSTAVTTQNWIDVTPGSGLVVTHVGLAFSLQNKPYFEAMLGIRVVAHAVFLDTRPSKDSAKIISRTQFCTDTSSSDQPIAALSNSDHLGREVGWAAAGITDLGNTDLYGAREARLDVVLSAAQSVSNYKLCYKPFGLPWMEVRETVGSDRDAALTTTDSSINPATSEVTSFTVSSTLIGQSGGGGSTTYLSLVSFTSAVIAGASTWNGATHLFSITYPVAPTAGRTYTAKFVHSYIENVAGSTYDRVPGSPNCFSTGISVTFTTTGTTTDYVDTNLPMTPGKWTVCLWSTVTAQWYQVPQNNIANPMPVIQSNLGFAAVGTTGLEIYDWYGAAPMTSYAGLSALDFVYVINATGGAAACGSTADYNGVARLTVQANLSMTSWGVDTTNYAAVRHATIALPPSTRLGSYVVCYQRTNAAATNTTGRPYTKANWYQLPNSGATFGPGTDFLVLTPATKLNITGCPVSNSSFKLRSGKVFSVGVIAQDVNNVRVPFAARGGVTAAAVTSFSLQGGAMECAADDAVNYGYTSAALTQSLDTSGQLSFQLTALSDCPSTGCQYKFSSAAGLTDSPTCTFFVKPTTVADVDFVVEPTGKECLMGTWCGFRVAASHTDGGIAHTVNTGLRLTITGATSTTFQGRTTDTGATVLLTGASGPVFKNGALDFEILFSPSAYSSTASESIVITATANGFSGTSTIVVWRPVLTGFHIVDIYPVALTNNSIAPLTPSWEPLLGSNPMAWRSSSSEMMPSTSVSAQSGYHLIAGQFYQIDFAAAVVTKATNSYATSGFVTPATYDLWLDTTVATALTTAGNLVIEGSGCASESCNSALATKSLGSSSTVSLRLRFMNALGTGSAIALPFKFGTTPALTTTLTTPVRSPATTLWVRCATSLSALPSSTTTCAGVSSTVNQGWYLNISAVDSNSVVDKFFTGTVFAVLEGKSAEQAARLGVKLTTIARLSAGLAALNVVSGSAVGGWVVLHVTVTNPVAFPGLKLQLLSDWGTGVVDAGSLVATPNTVRLQATLTSTHPYCSSTSTAQCNSVAGLVTTNTTNTFSLIYSDTRICAAVTAVDSNGNPTLYETNWVMYYAQDTTADGSTQALTLTDDSSNTGFVQRYKAMKNSAVSFCFTISGFTSSRLVTVSFGAQRFGGASYWASGSTGMASLWQLRVYPKKVIAAVLLESMTGGDIVVGGSVASVSASTTMGSTKTLALTFVLKDHYNKTATTSQLAPAELSKNIRTRLNDEGAIRVTDGGSTALRGNTNVTLTAAASTLNATAASPTATIVLDGYCLGCMIGFDLVDNTSTPTGINTNVTLYVVNTATTVTRALAFSPATSPFTSYWVNGTGQAWTSNSQPTYHKNGCLAGSCTDSPFPGALNLASCDSRASATTFGASATTGLKMRVYTMPSTASLNSVFEPTDNRGQVDILTTYQVAVSLGNQILSCQTTYGSSCGNDNSAAPVQTLQAYGANVRDAVGNFMGVSDAGIRSTNFFLVGLTASSFLEINTTSNKLNAAPSVGGAFSATATATGITVSSISSAAGFGFYFRPPQEARYIAIESTALNADACNDTSVYSCTGGTGCSVAGIAQSGSVTSGLAFAYASNTPVTGVAFPITATVNDVNARRVSGASGTMHVTIASWKGCNNGGGYAASWTGTVTNGRATVWITFATPCQSCVLEFYFAPSSTTGVFATIAANPNFLFAYSSPITVRAAASVAGTQVIIASSTPASAITPSATTALTVATGVTLNFQARGNFGRVPYASTNSGSVNIYNTISAASDLYTYGNGGVLRTSLSGDLWRHNQLIGVALAGGVGSATVFFTRTCVSCTLRVSWWLTTGASGAFDVPSTFTVTTTATMATLVGYVPRKVGVNRDIAIALWSTGSEDTSIPVAGRASPASASTVSVTSAATTATNGNGGTLQVTTFRTNDTQVHRLSWSAPCSVCTVTAGSNSFRMRILTTATQILPQLSLSASDIALGMDRPATRANLNQWVQTDLRALDDNGMIDEDFGIRGGCQWPEERYQCSWMGRTPSVGLSVDNAANGGFLPNIATFMVGDATGVTVGDGVMYNGVGTSNYSFTLPQRQVIPTFTAGGISSIFRAGGGQFPVPKYSVALASGSAGLTGLNLQVHPMTAVNSMTEGVANTFFVGLTGTVAASTTKRFVAVGATNNIDVTFSSACPAANVTTASKALIDGLTSFSISFASSVLTTAGCTITFTAATGTGRCGLAADCMAAVTGVTVAALRATRYGLLRPTQFDNGIGAAVRPMYAQAGKSMRVRAGLFGFLASGVEVAVSNCPTCALTVSSTDCNFGTASITSAFGSRSWAEVSLPFPDQGAATYSCNIKVEVTDALSALLPGADRTTTSFTYTVSVCKSASVRLLTNTSSAFRGQTLKTGTAYEFYAVMLTAAGAQCWGDSQDDATTLTLSAVDALTGSAVQGLEVVNVNSTSTTTTAYANGNQGPSASTSVQAVGGAFRFWVVFTNSTVRLGLTGGARVKITAAALSSSATSGPVHTVISAAALHFGPMQFPSHIVKNWAVVTGPMHSTEVSVWALDDIPASWKADGLISGTANVAKGATEYGNNANVFWRVSPPPAGTLTPIVTTGGNAATTLSAGTASWASVAFAGNDGVYGLSVQSATPDIRATMPITVFSQTASGLRLRTAGFTTTAPATCGTTSCALPNTTFTQITNTSIQASGNFLTTGALREFTLSVLVVDSTDMPVVGDNASVIMASLANVNAASTLALGVPPSFATRGQVYARVEKGVAVFKLAFLGSTLLSTGIENLASLSFSCPATKPASMLRPGEPSANPCASLTTISSRAFQVVNPRIDASAFAVSSAIRNAQTVVKVKLAYTNFQAFNFEALKAQFVAKFPSFTIGYIDASNIDKVLVPVICTVGADFSGDLGSTVCQGSPQTCSSAAGNPRCPRGVLSCACPTVQARSLLLRRFLLQNSSSVVNGSSISSEFYFNLIKADGFPAKNEAEAVAEYTKVNAAILSILADPTVVARFQILSVGTRASNVAVTTLPPTPAPTAAPGSPPTVAPATATPPKAPKTSAASPVHLMLALLLAALLALLA